MPKRDGWSIASLVLFFVAALAFLFLFFFRFDDGGVAGRILFLLEFSVICFVAWSSAIIGLIAAFLGLRPSATSRRLAWTCLALNYVLILMAIPLMRFLFERMDGQI